MSKRKGIDWSSLKNASPKPKRLHLEKESDEKYHCPVPNCEHAGFTTQRGCRKHVKLNHGWFYHFDEKPDESESVPNAEPVCFVKQKTNGSCYTIPSFPVSNFQGESFYNWLTGCGGAKSARDAKQTVSRAFKFLKFCCEDEDELTFDIIDFAISSPVLLFKFVDALQEEYNVGHSGRVGYIDAISELIDFRKINGAVDSVLRNVSITEVHLKKARKSVAKMMKLKWICDLDIDTLESKGHWATMDELLQVIPFHLSRYEQVLQMCQNNLTGIVCALDLSFATRFIAVYLFIQVKSSRPMTYQYLTTQMIETAKTNGGFVDQKQFKTAKVYSFDFLVLTERDLKVIDDYIQYIRPRLEPKCDYVLVTRNGKQYDKLSNLMTKMVFDAIGKYIHPSRYRQIVETESVKNLTKEEQDAVSEDQKHSSVVARVHYQKQRSRDIAKKGHECLKKLQGEKGECVEQYIHSKLCSNVVKLDDLKKDDDCECEETSNEQCRITPLKTPQPKENDACTIIKQEKPTKTIDTCPNLSSKPRQLRFTTDEDANLKTGIKRHGYGHWCAILRDPCLNFQTGRKADSLKKRAESKFPNLRRKNV